MMHRLFRPAILFSVTVLMSQVFPVRGQIIFQHPEDMTFIKKELNSGFKFNLSPEGEEFFTDETFFQLEQTIAVAQLFVENRNLVFLPSRQEQWRFNIEIGPFFGKGLIADSSAVEYIDANTSPAGLRGNAGATYSSRFYWDNRNYTMIDLSAWGMYDLFRNNADGTATDSNNIIRPYKDDSYQQKHRYGFQAKAGWGFGRINPVNNFATAQWLLEKHYPGRIFSSEEINAVAREIGLIKHRRNWRTGHSSDVEAQLLSEFLNREMLLLPPVGIKNDWVTTELRPRYHGRRVEAGPYFNYFNREPDFVYGGFIRYEHYKYRSINWNQNIIAQLSYNGYKRDDWVTFMAAAGLSRFYSFKHEIDFGVRYIGGMIYKGVDDLQPVRHAIIPYLEYFSQLNSKYRIETALAYRLAGKDEFVFPGPELTLSVYRSRY